MNTLDKYYLNLEDCIVPENEVEYYTKNVLNAIEICSSLTTEEKVQLRKYIRSDEFLLL